MLASKRFYYWTLSQAYRYGDLSLVYPLARGSAPVLVPLLAAMFLGEHLTALAAGGIALVAVGILTIHLPVGVWSGGWSGPHGIAATLGQLGTRYALLTGLVIATYSSLDKRGVALVPPLLYAYLLFVGLTAALVPLVRPQWDAVVREWASHRNSIIVVGLLTPGQLRIGPVRADTGAGQLRGRRARGLGGAGGHPRRRRAARVVRTPAPARFARDHGRCWRCSSSAEAGLAPPLPRAGEGRGETAKPRGSMVGWGSEDGRVGTGLDLLNWRERHVTGAIDRDAHHEPEVV